MTVNVAEGSPALAKATWPDTSVPQGVRNIVSRFYRCVDNTADPRSAAAVLRDKVFVPGGLFVINERTLQGDGILTWAAGGDAIVKTRRHTVEQVFTSGAGGGDIIMTGRLFLATSVGAEAEIGYVARCVVDDPSKAECKIARWQGWFDTAPLTAMVQQGAGTTS